MAKKTAEEPLRYNRLKVVLAEKNISQKKLSEMVGVEPNTISRICSNLNQPSIQLLYKIGSALGVDVFDLLNSIADVKKIAKDKK
jgi:putative transcriptional regulator